MVWQLCFTKSLLSSKSRDESMSFKYPISIARDVVYIGRSVRRGAIESHGILEKVWDIVCSLTDVLQLQLLYWPAIELGLKDCLVEMVKLLGTVLEGNLKYSSLLAAKVDDC